MRLIDADAMLSELKPITYEMEQNTVTIADMSNIMRNWVCRQPTAPAYGQWVSVKDRLPEVQKEVLIYLPEYDSVEIAALFEIPSMNLREWAQNEDAYMLDEVSYWMPLPEPPEERYKCRYADGDGVCDKCSANGEIIYCVEGPCPYMFEEARDDGAHIKP